ncbi:MAG: hypothetical protein II192_09320 [Clostridia bacterium]|nr:hypothetical protein [Clostridia bacterium]
MKKTRLYVGITLLVQAVSFVIMFIILAAKKKSLAAAFLAVAAMEGAAGGYLLWQYRQDEKEYEAQFGEDFLTDEDMDLDDDSLRLFGEDEETVPKDTEASEADFQ